MILEDAIRKPIRTVAGVDASYMDGEAIGAAAVLDFRSLLLLDHKTAHARVTFPYVPTLLGFREYPVVFKAVQKLKVEPDIFMVDGHGYAHPYRCGFACQFGVKLQKPTVGVAKSHLYGEIEKNPETPGIAYVRHNGDTLGAAVTTQPHSKPVFVSVGNMISLPTAVEIVKNCTRDHRIPEPLRIAHLMAATEKRKIQIRKSCNNKKR